MTKEESSNPPTTQEKDLRTGATEGGLPAERETAGMDAELEEFVKSAPQQVRHTMLSMMRLQGAGPLPHPIFEKFKPEHVDKFLEYSHEDDVNTYNLARSSGTHRLIYFFGILGFLVFLFLTVGATDKPLLTEIIRMGILVAGTVGERCPKRGNWVSSLPLDACALSRIGMALASCNPDPRRRRHSHDLVAPHSSRRVKRRVAASLVGLCPSC